MSLSGAILVCVGLWYWYNLIPKRVHRQHSRTAVKEFEYLTKKIDVRSRDRSWINRWQVEKDLEELEWLLKYRYSYLKLKGVDYKAALDSIRNSVGDGIGRGTLAIQLRKFIAIFGDGHSGVADPSFKRMFPGFLPFLIAQSQEKIVAFKTDHSDFLDRQHPFISKIDGIELETWLQIAGQIAAQGSPQFIRQRSIRNLRLIQYLRSELGLDTSDSVTIELESADGQSKKIMSLTLTDEYPVYGPWPKTESRILPENIGYLRIPDWMSNEPDFLDELVTLTNGFRDTQGLIIDIRGIGGGSRAPLRVLLPFFMADNAPPRVVNIAAYRLGHRESILDARWLYPEDWDGWSVEEKAAVKQAAETFHPEWRPPEDEFSQWHYFVIRPWREKGYYYYNHPVIILMDITNYSASDIFLGAFKGHPNITLMGTPSGGGSGRYQPYRLHYSHIALTLSSMASFQPDGSLYDGNGIQPDVFIEPAPTDFIGQTDTILDTAIHRLTGK